MTDFDHAFKVLLIGDSLGKKELISVLFPETINSAPRLVLNFDFYLKTIDCEGKKIKMVIWDRVAADRFDILLSHVLKGANGVVIAFQTLNSEFMTKLTRWHKIIRKRAGNIPIILIKVNSELANFKEEPREEVMALDKTHVTHYFEIMARHEKDNEHLIQEIANLVLQYHIRKDQNYNMKE